MTNSKSLSTLGLALACAALTFSLAVRAQAQTVSFIARLTGSQRSTTGVIQATDGNFYGAAEGGANGYGEIFRMTPTGQLSTIYDFCSQPNCADGIDPYPGPILGSDGNLYGVTEGGINVAGTFYKMTLDGNLTTLYTSCLTSCTGGVGLIGVVQGSGGNFYGAMYAGGNSSNGGTIVSISPTGKFKLLYTFCSLAKCADGQNPLFPPIQGSDGNLYGATFSGGSEGGGVVYELTPSGTFTVLHNFCGNVNNCESGANPSTIVEDANGNLFGTAFNLLGVVFEITSTRDYEVLHRFYPGVDGLDPFTGLTLASDGNFYGMTMEGGTTDSGTIFEITPTGEFTSLYSFASPKGYDPAPGPLFQATDGSFYGATDYSAPPSSYGTIFRLSNGLSPLVETAPVAGKVGQSIIILGNGLAGATSVTFNGVEAAFTVESETYIKATVPKGATTGTVSVVTPRGTLNSNPQFVVTK